MAEPIFALLEKRQDEWNGEMLPGWYFWDETWANCHGPFATATECRNALEEYFKQL